MATYPIINTETGEQKEVVMSVHDWDQWKTDNPEWIRDFSDPSTCPTSGNVGDPRAKLMKSHPGWGEIMKGVKKAAPTNSSITSQY